MSKLLPLICLFSLVFAGVADARPGAAADSSPEVIVSPGDDMLFPGPEQPATAGCNVEAARYATGRVATPRIIRQLKRESGAAMVRVLRHGEGATRDFLPGRLNLIVGRNNIIKDVRCG